MRSCVTAMSSCRPNRARISTDRSDGRHRASYLKLPSPEDKGAFLNRIHEKVDVQRLNDLRLAVIREMNEEPWTRLSYFNTARKALEVLVGNELAMQLRINLSIQLPNDDSSLLPVHADVWAGDSPYEVVLWTLGVDVYGTKTMFIRRARRMAATRRR